MVRITDLTKSYGGAPVLDRLSLTLPDGAVTVLMAPSGAGKTTLAHILLGLVPADSGTVEGLAGRRLAAVFQEDRLCEQLTAIGNVQLVLHGPPRESPSPPSPPHTKRAAGAVVREELAAVGLDADDIRKPVSQLSGGQRRRVAIVRALLADADFVCLDEPFKGLDEATKDRVMAYVRSRAQGRTVLLITHDPAEAEHVGGQVITL